jgi:hypothetical protein
MAVIPPFNVASKALLESATAKLSGGLPAMRRAFFAASILISAMAATVMPVI